MTEENVQVMIEGQVETIPLGGYSKDEVLETVRAQLVDSNAITDGAKVVDLGGYYGFQERHGTAGLR